MLSFIAQNATMEQIIFNNYLNTIINTIKPTTLQIYVKIIMTKFLNQKVNLNACTVGKDSIK